MNNILILDLDGVINVTIPNLKHEHVYLLDQKQEDLFIPQLAKNINKLCKAFDFKIVISSTWRKHYSIQELEYLLRYMGIEAPIIGITPVINDKSRAFEIQSWAKENKSMWAKYYVLDDMYTAIYDKDEHISHKGFYLTSNEGLSNNAYKQCLIHLKSIGY